MPPGCVGFGAMQEGWVSPGLPVLNATVALLEEGPVVEASAIAEGAGPGGGNTRPERAGHRRDTHTDPR